MDDARRLLFYSGEWGCSKIDGFCQQAQLGTKLQRADEALAEQMNSSRNQVQRFIRLTELIPTLLDQVDEHKISFNPAVELSYLTESEQTMFADTLEYEGNYPSLSQAQRLKKFSQQGKLTEDVMLAIMSEPKKSDLDKITLSAETLDKYFPRSYTPRQKQEVIISLLETWHQQQHDDLSL